MSVTDRDDRFGSSLTTRIRKQGAITRVVVSGDLDLVGARALDRALRPVLRRGARHVVIDLRAVGFIDSTGVRALIHQHALLARARGRLELSVGDTQAVYRTLALSGVTDNIARRP